MSLPISKQPPTPDYKRNGDCEPAVYFLENQQVLPMRAFA
jgi:hypothetical protein